jgi:hypothetical protein
MDPNKNNRGAPISINSELHGISITGKAIGLMVMIYLISTSYYAFGFFLLGMLPSILAIIMDKGAGRFASQTISACNFIGILPFLFDIGVNYEKSIAAKEAMGQPYTWFIIYSFAIIGLMLIYVLPNVTSIIFTIKAEAKLKKLAQDQERIKNEWGENISSFYDK